MAKCAAPVTLICSWLVAACGSDAIAPVAPGSDADSAVNADATSPGWLDADDVAAEGALDGAAAPDGDVLADIGEVAAETTPIAGCGNESVAGRCDGSEIVYCESSESGVARVECAPDYECGERDGYAECRLPGSGGCGGVTYEGYCDGNVAVYCNSEVTEIVRYDCGADGLPCGFVDDETGYYCLELPGGGAFSVSGAFYFEKPALGEGGLGAVSDMPVRNAIVQVRAVSDDVLIATGVSDESGAFTVAFDAPGGDVYALALAGADDDRHHIFVRDCPREDCEGAGYVHAVYSETFTPSFGGDIGGWVAAIDGSAGAFNIFDVFMRGQDFAWANFGVPPPLVTGQWERGSGTTCGVSCFSERSNTIYVLGIATDTDEFDDPVLGHEFGHYLEAVYSRSDSPGGSHDGSPTDPRLAWSEGYGTFAGCELMGSPIYIDSAAGGASVIDVRDTGFTGNPSGSLTQLVSEYLVAQTLWTLSRGGSVTGPLGAAVIFDVLGAYFPTGWLADRGVAGVDLVDFLDGLLCRGAGRSDEVQRVVVEQRKFPYDFAGPGSCR